LSCIFAALARLAAMIIVEDYFAAATAARQRRCAFSVPLSLAIFFHCRRIIFIESILLAITRLLFRNISWYFQNSYCHFHWLRLSIDIGWLIISLITTVIITILLINIMTLSLLQNTIIRPLLILLSALIYLTGDYHFLSHFDRLEPLHWHIEGLLHYAIFRHISALLPIFLLAETLASLHTACQPDIDIHWAEISQYFASHIDYSWPFTLRAIMPHYTLPYFHW